MLRVQSKAHGRGGTYASSQKCFQTGTGTNSAFYMYERRYATEPFTAVEPSAPVDWAFGPRGEERGRGGLVSALR
jgi:hypothetical protein